MILPATLSLTANEERLLSERTFENDCFTGTSLSSLIGKSKVVSSNHIATFGPQCSKDVQ